MSKGEINRRGGETGICEYLPITVSPIVRVFISSCFRLTASPLLVFFLLLSSHFLVPISAYASDLGGKIKAIEVEGLSRLKKEELLDMIGDVTDRETLRNGIKRAFKKGIFVDIKAVAEPYEDGIKLRYVVKEIPLIKDITIQGNMFISKREIKKHFIFKEGKDFREGLIDKARAGLLDFYHRKGFPDAKIRINVVNDKTPSRININLQIEEGTPLIIQKINILPAVKSRIKILEGDIFDIGRVEKDIEKLKRYYKKQKYIKPVIGPYKFIDGELTIPIVPGPRLEVIFKGNDGLSSKRLLKEVPFLEDEEVTGELLQETINRIKRLYQKKGYYHVQVTGGIETEENLIRVVFFIFEGKKVFVKEIQLEGVSISPEAIKSIIPLEESEPFDDTILSSCRESIIRFYHALGYINVDVTEIRKNFIGDGSELNLVFVIHEGSQIRIKKINFVGNTVIDTSEIREALSIREEDPYNEIDIGNARYKILSLYNRSGYIDAQVDVESVIDAGMAAITFKITENNPSVFGKIIIRGNEKTKNKIIRREFAIKEGKPYDYEAIFKTRQRLSKLGLFTDISIEPLEASYLKKSEKEGDIYIQDVLVDLKEGNPGAVEMGLGYGEYEHLRGFFDIGYRNLGGYNRQIGLRTELSSIKKRYILNFTEPWLFNKPRLSLNASLIKEDVRSVNIDTKDVMYKVDRLSLIVGVDKEFTENLKGSLNYEYALIETTDVKPGVILSKEDTGTLGISSISPSLFYDTRDNPFDPTSGSLNGVVLKFASGVLFSETEFIKAAFQSSWYFQIKKGLIFAFSFKGGVAHGLGDTVELPIIERFFLGGRTTVRGYDQDTLGPKGAEDDPTGGNVFALANVELRQSIGKGFGIVIFVDTGNVWKRVDNIGSTLRYTTGLGLRYHTPVGPIRIDYGQKLNKERGESAGEIHFSLGHAF